MHRFSLSTKIRILFPVVGMVLAVGLSAPVQAQKQTIPGKVEVVSEMNIRPGNVAVSKEGRVFATIHPFGGNHDVQLVEITGKSAYRAWPSAAFQNNGKDYPDDRIDSPLGIHRDGKNRLWITDMGMHSGRTRVWAFDIATGTLYKRFDLPETIAPKGSFVQDLVVDEVNNWIYLADIANPGIIAVDMASGTSRRFGNHPSLQAEPGATMRIGGKNIHFQGKPANVAINPITLSADKETIYYGAMNGRTWYAVSARLFRQSASDQDIAQSIRKVGPKPVSDGAATDEQGNHYFTNLNENGIDVLTAKGALKPLVRGAMLDWPDNVALGPDSWLYIAVNQLHKTPAFTGAQDEGRPPYYILRTRIGNARSR